MKLITTFGLLLLLLFACKLCNLTGGDQKRSTNIQALIDPARLIEQTPEAIDQTLGVPESVEPLPNGESRYYRLKDGSRAMFVIYKDLPSQPSMNNRAAYVNVCLKNGTDTPQEALKYVGIEVGATPPRTPRPHFAEWRVTVQSKPLYASVATNEIAACEKDNNRRGAWVSVLVKTDPTAPQNSMPSPTVSDDRALLTELMALEEKWRDAMLEGDMATVESLTAADFVNKFENVTETRSEYIEGRRRGVDATWYKIRNPQLVNRSANSATISIEVTFTTKAGQTVRARDIDTWVKRGGRWQIAKSESVDL